MLLVAGALAGCSGGDDAPAADDEDEATTLRFERVDDEEFHSVGDRGSLLDAAANSDGHAVAVGSVVDGQNGHIRPLVLESSDGAAWSTARLTEPESDAYPTAVTALPDGGFVAIGTLTTSNGIDPALWRRDPNGQWGDPVVPDTLSSDRVEDPRSIAAGPAGIMATSLVDGRPTIWTSADGEEWQVATTGRLDESAAIVAATVGDRFVVIVDDREAGQLRVLTSDDGTDFADQGSFGQPNEREVHDAAYFEGRYFLVGGRRSPPDGDLRPVAWSSADGVSWTPGADLPHDPETQANRGAWADAIGVGGGRAAISSASGHRLWLSVGPRDFVEAAGSKPDPIVLDAPVVMAGPTPTLVGSGSLFGLSGDEWTERSPGVVPQAERRRSVSDVTHGPGGFVAVGVEESDDATEPDGSAIVGVVWRSEDGRAWEQMPADPDLAGSRLAAVSTYAGGYVAVGTGGDGDIDRVGRIFLSPDGTEWTAASGDGMVPPARGVHQLQGVTPFRTGFVATGYGFDAVAIRPLILVSTDGTTVRRVEVPGDDSGRRPDQITLGTCGTDDMAVVVGIDSGGAAGYAAVWSSGDSSTWEPWPSSDEIGALHDCATSPDGRTLASGEVGRDERAAVAELTHDAPVELEELPGVEAVEQQVEAPVWVDEVPVLVGQGDDDPGGGAAVWIGPRRDDGGRWRRLAGGPLGGPGSQHAYGAATDGRAVVMVGTGPEGGIAWTARWSAPPG